MDHLLLGDLRIPDGPDGENRTMTTNAIVVMEPGGDWPGQVGDLTSLVAFGPGGEELLRRAEEKVKALRRAKQEIRVAVIACNSATGGVVDIRRVELARLLLRAVKNATRGRLVLSASGRASRQFRQELFALAGELSEELGKSSTTITVRFIETSHRNAVPLMDTRSSLMTGTDA